MNYSLTKSKMVSKDGRNIFRANCLVTARLSKKEVIAKMTYGCTLTEADIIAVFSRLEKVIVDYISLGCSLDLGFLSVGYGIRGRFESQLDFFRKDRHRISIHSVVSKSISNAVNHAAKPEKILPKNRAPVLQKIIKLIGIKSSPEFMAGNFIQLSGSKLSFDRSDIESGVFLQSETGDTVRVNEYAQTGGTRIILRIPDGLKPGSNKVELRNRISDGTILRGVLGENIIIAA